jgi:hypothetical protein
MKPSKLRTLIRKLKALAAGGVGGEAEQAKIKLAELLEKYDIQLDDVQEHIRIWELTTLNEGSVILKDVIKSICPEAVINVKQYKSRLTIEVAMSDADYQEAVYKYKFVWSAYNRERQLFLSAFKNRNSHLFTPERNSRTNPASASQGEKPPIMPPIQLVAGEVPMATEEQKRVGIIMSALKMWRYIRTNRMIGNETDEH